MFENLDLNLIWFILLGLLLTGYAMLDGFDFGVGALHLFSKGDRERRLIINSIGPVWDGNEVWLVTGGGALFAAFPDVYATLASGFYIPVHLLLFALIFRAVAIEFRSKQPGKGWRRTWDLSFCFSSILCAFLFGVVLGNLIWGIPIDQEKEFYGTLLSVLHPYPILVGILVMSMCMMHGSIYLVMKTEGEFHDNIRVWVRNCIIFFLICYFTTTMATLLYCPHMVERFRQFPVLFILPVINLLAVANVPREIYRGRDFAAFISSCVSIIMLMFLFGFGIFPNLAMSNPNFENSLTIYNAASSQKTLSIMLIMALIGMPLVMAYTFCIYWIFRGKVKLHEMSY